MELDPEIQNTHRKLMLKKVPTDFSQYCDALNIKRKLKNENFIANGGKIIQKEHVTFAQ